MALTDSQKQIVLTELKQGANLAQACKSADISRRSDILDELQRDDEFAVRYARARELGYTLLADDLQAVSDDLSIPSDHRRIMVDTRKWMLSKMLPKIYGDRLNLDHSGSIKRDESLSNAELEAIATRGRGVEGKVEGGE